MPNIRQNMDEFAIEISGLEIEREIGEENGCRSLTHRFGWNTC